MYISQWLLYRFSLSIFLDMLMIENDKQMDQGNACGGTLDLFGVVLIGLLNTKPYI